MDGPLLTALKIFQYNGKKGVPMPLALPAYPYAQGGCRTAPVL